MNKSDEGGRSWIWTQNGKKLMRCFSPWVPTLFGGPAIKLIAHRYMATKKEQPIGGASRRI